MAILVQSFLNSATRLSTTATTATTVVQLKALVNAIEGVSTSTMQFYIVNPSTTSTALVSGTLGSYGITTATTIYSSNTISTLAISSGTTLTKNVNPPHSNVEIVAPFSNIWSLNYTGALGATNDVSYKLYVTSLGIGSAFTLTSHYGDNSVTAGNFLYDTYGTSLGIIKGNATIDNYMAKAAAVCGSLSNSVITAATYKGTWNAFTNTPTLTDGVGTLGDAYDVDTAGTSGAYPAYGQQDWRIYDGSVWQRVDKTTTTQWTIAPAAAGLADKQSRQIAKLELAKLRRQAGGDTSSTFYRALNVYDIDLLADKYTSNTSTVGTTSTLTIGRPWVSYISAGLQVFLRTAPITGTTWTDASGNGNNATIVNTYEGNYVYNSNLGGHITLDGAQGAGLNISGYNLPTDGGTYSVEVVASIYSTNYWSSLFGNDDFTLNKGVVAYYGNSSNFYISTPTSNGVYAPVSLATRQNINQYIITVTGNTVKFYLNGVSQALTNNTGGSPGFTASSGTPTNGLMIGARHPNAGTAGVPYDSANGSYYLVRVYNTLLSQSDVTINYNAIKTTYGI